VFVRRPDPYLVVPECRASTTVAKVMAEINSPCTGDKVSITSEVQPAGMPA